jgi:integrase
MSCSTKLTGVQLARTKFTSKKIQDHTCPAGKAQAFLWDASSPGLALRITANGARSYVFQGRLNDKSIRVTIGDPRSWTIDQAQEEARRLQRMLDEGKDPREVKAEQRAAHEARAMEKRRQLATFGEAWDEYILSRKPRWSERHMRDHIVLADVGGKPKRRGPGVTMAGPLAELRLLTLSELTGEKIAHWLTSHSADRPTVAALAYRLLRAFLRWAADVPAYRGIITSDVYGSQNVRDAVPRVRPKEGDVLQREQLPKWFAAVRGIQNPVVSAYLQGLLITGARREELAGLIWADVDFQWNSLTIRDKVEGERQVPLTPYFSALLLQLPRRNKWVFSSPTSSDGKLTEPTFSHRNAIRAAGLPHVSLHGLRRSFGTLCEWIEMPAGISAQIMGHKPSAIAEKHYRRRPLDLLRAWHIKIEKWVMEQAGIEFDFEQTKPVLQVITAA